MRNLENDRLRRALKNECYLWSKIPDCLVAFRRDGTRKSNVCMILLLLGFHKVAIKFLHSTN